MTLWLHNYSSGRTAHSRCVHCCSGSMKVNTVRIETHFYSILIDNLVFANTILCANNQSTYAETGVNVSRELVSQVQVFMTGGILYIHNHYLDYVHAPETYLENILCRFELTPPQENWEFDSQPVLGRVSRLMIKNNSCMDFEWVGSFRSERVITAQAIFVFLF